MTLEEEFNTQPPHPRVPWWREWHAVDVIRSISLVLILAATFILFGQARQTQGQIDDQKERGFINRAAICQLQEEQGAQLSKGCDDPRVVKYYDPKAPVAKQNQALICELARALDAQVASCASTS